MATTTARRRTSQPIMKAWDAVKGLGYSDKLELVTMIIESVKADKADDMSMEQMLEGYPYKRYTMDEINAMLDKAEATSKQVLAYPTKRHGMTWKRNSLSRKRSSTKWPRCYESSLGSKGKGGSNSGCRLHPPRHP